MMLSTLQTLRDRAIEAALHAGATRAPVNERWRVTDEELDDVIVRWPVTYQWPTAKLWVEPLLAGFRKRTRVEFAELPQPYGGTVIFQFVMGGKAHDIAVDYSDYPEVNQESVARCAAYFKMQHLREGYGFANVLPGGYVPGSRQIYLHLSRLRRLRDAQDFRFEVYGRFSTEFAGETRRRAAAVLTDQQKFQFEGGLKKVKYLDFLKEIARARVCIDLPGEGDLCFRLINYLAVGACVVGPAPRSILNGPLIDGVHVAYCKPDFSDLVEVCSYYLQNEEAREEMCRRSRNFFDEYLHKDNLTAYYLRSCLDRLRY
jgi:glycosyl transferase family 1